MEIRDWLAEVIQVFEEEGYAHRSFVKYGVLIAIALELRLIRKQFGSLLQELKRGHMNEE